MTDIHKILTELADEVIKCRDEMTNPLTSVGEAVRIDGYIEDIIDSAAEQIKAQQRERIVELQKQLLVKGLPETEQRIAKLEKANRADPRLLDAKIQQRERVEKVEEDAREELFKMMNVIIKNHRNSMDHRGMANLRNSLRKAAKERFIKAAPKELEAESE